MTDVGVICWSYAARSAWPEQVVMATTGCMQCKVTDGGVMCWSYAARSVWPEQVVMATTGGLQCKEADVGIMCSSYAARCVWAEEEAVATAGCMCCKRVDIGVSAGRSRQARIRVLNRWAYPTSIVWSCGCYSPFSHFHRNQSSAF